MLTGIAAWVLKSALPGIIADALPKILDLFGRHQDGKITQAQLEAELRKTLADKAAEVDVAALDAGAQTFAAFNATLRQSRIVQAVWAMVMISQLFVLTWYQWVVPFGTLQSWWVRYPSPGATVDWAYLIVAGGIGLAPFVFKGRTR